MNHEGYRDPTADIAIKNAEREVKAMHIDILRGDIFYVKKWGVNRQDPNSGRDVRRSLCQTTPETGKATS